MKILKQSMPIQKFGLNKNVSLQNSVTPSACRNGTIDVTLKDGTKTSLTKAAACCYNSRRARCIPCGHNYDKLIGETFSQCGENNVNKCYWKATCPRL